MLVQNIISKSIICFQYFKSKENETWNRLGHDDKLTELERGHANSYKTEAMNFQSLRVTSTSNLKGNIKSKENKVIFAKEDILNRWKEFIGELFDAARNEEPPEIKECTGLPIITAEKYEELVFPSAFVEP